MPTRLANLGYMALIKEVTKGTPLIPNVFVPLYKESLFTKVNLDADSPIAGNKADVFQHIQGLRDHTGELQVLAEPVTAGPILDMFLKQGTPSGSSDPYTHPYTLDATTDPKSYTVDICKGQVVCRFIGVEVSELSHEFSENKMLFNLSVAARKSFIVREIASVTSTEIIFKTNYDPSPTAGLVATDTIRCQKAAGTYLDTTVTSVDSIIKITVGSTTGLAGGDLVFLRPATPSFALLEPFLWSRTEYRISATSAAVALSATHTPLESGSAWKLLHNLANKEGEKRSGSFDPAELARTTGGAEFELKQKFDDAADMNRFLTNQKISLVARHFSGTNHELRVTLNKLKFAENPVELNTGELLYAEGKMKAEYDADDGQLFDVTLINASATI